MMGLLWYNSNDVVDMNNASEGILQEIQKDDIKWK